MLLLAAGHRLTRNAAVATPTPTARILVILSKAILVKTLMEEPVVGEVTCTFARRWSVHQLSEVAKANNFVISTVLYFSDCAIITGVYNNLFRDGLYPCSLGVSSR